MAATPMTDLVMAAANLKGIAGHQYQQLCDALRGLEAQSIVELAAADGTDVYRAQGKFRFLKQLRENFVKCSELRETFQRRNNDARSQPGPTAPNA